MKKDATVTIRLPQATRRRLQSLARREGRSLSQQAERLIERGMTHGQGPVHAESARPLSGRLRGVTVATARDFRGIRTLLSEALVRRTETRGHARR